MRSILREARFFARTPSAVAAVLILALLASAGVAAGLGEIARERAAMADLVARQAEEDALLAERFADAGAAAYGTFHLTWNAPSPLAFAASGRRDVAPNQMRVRALALEGQIYENEPVNPELALPGRFGFAFVVIYLAPLFLFALLHDLWSGEREAGRAAVLQAAPGAARRVFGARAAVRIGAVTAALLPPFAVGAFLAGASLGSAAAFAGLTTLFILFWSAVALVAARFGPRSAVNAAALAGAWFVLTLAGPALGDLAVNAAVPAPDGAVIARENREAVHGAWDLPRQETLDRFVALHPEWTHTAPMDRPFHWKWYFAFQHLGDLAVAEPSAAYREAVLRRDQAAGVLGFVLPPAGFQRALHRLAETDATSQVAYQDRVREFHGRLRAFYYPYLFEDRPFGPDDFRSAPRFDPAG